MQVDPRLTPAFDNSPSACLQVQRSKLKHDKPLSNFCFNCNLRPSSLAVAFGDRTETGVGGGLSDHMLEQLDDSQVFEALIALKGIGAWWGLAIIASHFI